MKRYWFALGIAGLALAVCAVLLVPGSTANGPLTSNVRLAHAALGAPAVDVWVDGSVKETNVSYKTVTPYVQLAAGPHTVEIKLSGLPITVISETVYLTSGVDLTIAGVGVGLDITTTALLDNNHPANKDTVRLVHTSPDTGPVDVLVTGTLTSAVVSGLPYKEASAYIGGLGVGEASFEVRPSGEITPVLTFTHTLQSGTINTFFIMGASTPPSSFAYPLKAVHALDRHYSFLYLPIVLKEYGP
jgi:hypothetical protein